MSPTMGSDSPTKKDPRKAELVAAKKAERTAIKKAEQQEKRLEQLRGKVAILQEQLRVLMSQMHNTVEASGCPAARRPPLGQCSLAAAAIQGAASSACSLLALSAAARVCGVRIRACGRASSGMLGQPSASLCPRSSPACPRRRQSLRPSPRLLALPCRALPSYRRWLRTCASSWQTRRQLPRSCRRSWMRRTPTASKCSRRWPPRRAGCAGGMCCWQPDAAAWLPMLASASALLGSCAPTAGCGFIFWRHLVLFSSCSC